MSARTGPAATIAPPRRALRGIWPAARLAWRSAPAWLLTHIAATAATAVLPVATVWLLKAVLDDLTAGRSGQLRVSALGLFVAGATAAGLAPVSRYLRNQLSRAIKVQSQSQLYLATARLAGLSRLEQPAFRDRLRMAQQIGQAGPGEVVDGLLGVGQRILTVVGLLGVLTVINPLIAGLAVLGTVPALYMEVRLSRSRAAMMFAISPVERREIFYAELLTTLTAAKELRLLGLSELFRRRMLTELATADGHRRRLDAREMRTQLALGVAAAALTGAGLVWAIQAAASGRLGVGDVSAFVAAMAAVQAGLPSLVSQVAGVYHSLAMFDHYRSVLDEPSDLPVAAHPRPVPPLRRGIELRDVWFRYGPDQPWILRGVNLTIPAGQALALVGLNGAGKSTMVKLLCRFYDPQRGSLHWDGLDLREFDVAELRQRIGAVFQDYMAYDLTAAENIGLGDVAHLDDTGRIKAAARRAGVDATLDRLPAGYQTLLSRLFTSFVDPEDPGTGVLLSGGQWQRVALARAFMRDGRDLLILDEPSAGLDAEAEHEIHRGLREHRAGTTSVLISHRLGAIRDADIIVVLADGVVAERGSHAHLVAAGGEYARLFQLQSAGYRDEASGHREDASGADGASAAGRMVEVPS